jgi:CTD small phosphatase-like protein 2
VSHRLYRQHCTLEKGLYIKDLRNLNRSLEDMVIVDNSSISYAVQPENGIPIIPFYDNNKDRELVTLLSYLRELLQQQDVRAMNR